jgi:hypothetical protein
MRLSRPNTTPEYTRALGQLAVVAQVDQRAKAYVQQDGNVSLGQVAQRV